VQCLLEAGSSRNAANKAYNNGHPLSVSFYNASAKRRLTTIPGGLSPRWNGDVGERGMASFADRLRIDFGGRQSPSKADEDCRAISAPDRCRHASAFVTSQPLDGLKNCRQFRFLNTRSIVIDGGRVAISHDANVYDPGMKT